MRNGADPLPDRGIGDFHARISASRANVDERSELETLVRSAARIVVYAPQGIGCAPAFQQHLLTIGVEFAAHRCTAALDIDHDFHHVAKPIAQQPSQLLGVNPSFQNHDILLSFIHGPSSKPQSGNARQASESAMD